MTNTQAPAPIMVNATPGADQWTAAIRQALLCGAGIATVFGAQHLAGEFSGLLTISAPAGGLVVFVLGQLAVRSRAKKMARMANALPDTVAQVKV